MPNKRAPGKVSVTFILDAPVRKRLLAVAKKKHLPISVFLRSMVESTLEDEDKFMQFSKDPAARRLMVEMLTKPGAIETMLRASGETLPPGMVQETLDQLLGPVPK